MGSENGAAVDKQDMQRLALQLALQLPKDGVLALTVVGYLRDVVKWQRGIGYTWHDEIGSGFEGGEVLSFPKRA